MKKMMMALAALCVAGAAGAVSIDWDTGYTWKANYTSDGTQGSAESTSDAKLSLGKTFDLSSDYLSITTVFTVNTLPGGSAGFQTILSLYDSSKTGAANRDTNIRLSLTNAVDGSSPQNAFTLNGNYSASGWDTPPKATVAPTAGQKYSATIVFNGGNATVTISSVGEDGSLTTVVTMTKENIAAESTVDSIILGTASVSESNGNRTFANGALTVESVTVVPEPTALALLALGVAGLALRRKAA